MKVPTVENVLEDIEQDVIQGNDVNLSSFDMHDCLNRKVWPTDGKLDAEIRDALLKIAKDFIAEMNLSEIINYKGKLSDLVKDIQFLGSLASFNYSKYSDVDLHILFDFKPLKLDDKTRELLKKYFWQLKNDWNNKHIDLTVRGYEVELYVQDADETNAANGVYSILKDGWVKFPEPMSSRNYDREYVRRKILKYANQIDALDGFLRDGNSNDTEKILELLQYIKDRVIKARRTALAASGNNEMAEDNIVFKALRRSNYIGKINDLLIMGYDKMNSITESTTFTLTRSQLRKLIEEETGEQVDENWLTRQLGKLWGGAKKVAGNQNVQKMAQGAANVASGAWGAVKDAGKAVGNKLNQWQADAQAQQGQNAGQDVAAGTAAGTAAMQNAPQDSAAAAAGVAAGAQGTNNAPGDATAAAAGVAAGQSAAQNAPEDAAAAGAAVGANMAKNAPEDATAAASGVAAGLKLSEYLTPADVTAAVTAGIVAYIRNNAAPDDQQAQPAGGGDAPAAPSAPAAPEPQAPSIPDVDDDVAIKGVIGKSNDEILRGKVWHAPKTYTTVTTRSGMPMRVPDVPGQTAQQTLAQARAEILAGMRNSLAGRG